MDAGLVPLHQLPQISNKEKQIQELFRYFCKKIVIPERVNEPLAKQLLPLRFRPDMVEFN